MCGNTCAGKKSEPPALDRSQLVVDTSGIKGADWGLSRRRLFQFVTGQDTADKLNSLKNGPTRVYLGQRSKATTPDALTTTFQ